MEIAERVFQGHRLNVKVIARPNALFGREIAISKSYCRLSVVRLSEEYQTILWRRCSTCSFFTRLLMFRLTQRPHQT